MVTVEEAVSEPEGFRLAGARRVVDPGTGDCMGGSDGPGWEVEAVGYWRGLEVPLVGRNVTHHSCS